MANGKPSSTSTQTRRTSPQPVKVFRRSWPESSRSQTSEQAQTLTGDNIEIGKEEGRGNETTSRSNPSQHDRHVQRQFLSENDSARMVESPGVSWNGSTNHDRTPRLKAADVARTPLQARSPSNEISPYRQDSAYESVRGNQYEESKVDVDIQVGNIRARERVEILRGRVFRTRSAVNESRQEVRLLRERLRDAMDKLMKTLNELMVLGNGQSLQTLVPHYDAVRIAQDALGPIEDAYDILEMRLNREEDELEQEEMHFYRHNNISLVPPPNFKLDQAISPLIKPYQPEDADFQGLDLENELVKQYFAKVSEAEHLKEQLDYLENEQWRLTEDLSFRTRYNLDLSEEKRTFLFEFPKAHRELLDQLETVEDALYDLRERCIQGQFFSASEHVYEPRDALVEEIYESVNDARSRSPLRTAVEHAPTYHQHEINFGDKRDYVNTWMLEWVQDSPVESARLRAFIYFEYPKTGKELAGEEWSELALEFWDKDKAGESANEKHVLSTMDALRGGTGTSEDREGSLDVDLGDAVIVEEYIMGSETGSYKTQRGEQTVSKASSI
jgi:hypothetical protein